MYRKFKVKVKRQDRPGSGSYWQIFELVNEPGMNMTTCLQRIAASPVTVEGEAVTPVAYEVACLEEICGSCTMLVNGRVRQACSTLVDELLDDTIDTITLEPMSKFPVVRDLFVNRQQMFDHLKQIKAWIPVDGYHALGAGLRQSQEDQEAVYPLSKCMTCGCCVEACPQFGPQSDFIGPAAISQVVFFNANPIGKFNAKERLTAIMGPGKDTARIEIKGPNSLAGQNVIVRYDDGIGGGNGEDIEIAVMVGASPGKPLLIIAEDVEGERAVQVAATGLEGSLKLDVAPVQSTVPQDTKYQPNTADGPPGSTLDIVGNNFFEGMDISLNIENAEVSGARMPST